jgi:hypothetical protein
MARLSKADMAEAKLRSRDWAAYLVRDHGAGAEAKLAESLAKPNLTALKRYQLKCTARALAVRRKRDITQSRSRALVAYKAPLFSLTRIAGLFGIKVRP